MNIIIGRKYSVDICVLLHCFETDEIYDSKSAAVVREQGGGGKTAATTRPRSLNQERYNKAMSSIELPDVFTSVYDTLPCRSCFVSASSFSVPVLSITVARGI
jgi:hypothetical protein